MDILIRYGFTIEEVKIMMDTNHKIENISDKNIDESINILKEIGCDQSQIKNILICNPFYITNGIKDIKKLLKKLYELGFKELFALFDTNPYLLNLSNEEITNIFNDKLKEGLTKEEVIDLFNRTLIF